MPVLNKIDNVWRENWSAHANIDSVWRDLDSWSNINGVWRENFKHDIDATSIIGFRMVYKLMEDAKHPDYPKLSVNKDLPVMIKLVGDRTGEMNNVPKGMALEYFRHDYEKEGILVYRGDLYGILQTGDVVNVGMSISNAASDQRVPGTIPGITEAWCTNKLAKISIQINAELTYESYGYFTAGWNSMFNKTQFLDPSNYPDKGPHDDKQELVSYSILPIESRNDTFDSASYIGIARDMTSTSNNMIGSSGIFQHQISCISVNGVEKPFTLEIYN